MHWIDPDCLPQTRGTVTRFLLNPHGELDGFVLDDSRQVHFPPHLSKQLARNVKIGDAVTVRGIKPRGADMIAAVAVMTKAGRTILDEGPDSDGKHHPPEVEMRQMEASGEVLLSPTVRKASCAAPCSTMARRCACRRTRPRRCRTI